MNPWLGTLAPYPLERLAMLLGDVTPNRELEAISLAIGEPQHPPAMIARDALSRRWTQPDVTGTVRRATITAD